ncbi:hypothetical protein WN944_018222 [Citrus x changshan-huyou]|uniref:Uncharacterized protein n=1 Tax=Citrus x changshan-huyou TaxID=2935761 RepID=A0AAP0LT01_9ROSI
MSPTSRAEIDGTANCAVESKRRRRSIQMECNLGYGWDSIKDVEKDSVENLTVHTIRRTQDEELLVVMDKDILRLIWNKIKSVQGSNGEK